MRFPQLIQQLREHRVGGSSRALPDLRDGGDLFVAVPSQRLVHEGLNLQRLVVVAVPDARVLQAGRLEQIQQGALVGERPPMRRPGLADLLRADRERLAPRAQRRERGAHRLEAALDVRHLAAHDVVALGGAHEGVVPPLRGLPAREHGAFALFLQALGLPVQLGHRKRQQVGEVPVFHARPVVGRSTDSERVATHLGGRGHRDREGHERATVNATRGT